MYKIICKIFETGIKTESPPAIDDALRHTSLRLADAVLQRFRGALAIRHVDASSCNGCELEIHALSNPYSNLEGPGIQIVASPRHADMLLVTGPVSRHMEVALKRTMDSLTTNAFPMDVTLGVIVLRIALGLLGLSILRHPGPYRCAHFPLDA